MLSLLQDFLRITVYGGERHEITLEEELRFVNQYLEIEKVRFSDKLEVSEEIDVDTLIACVPSFLLQPIVENAIRHAIAPKSSRGILRICTRKEEGRLMILVEDDGPGLPVFDKKNVKEGVGLKIAKERLDYIFGEAHSFTLGKSTLGGLKVEIRIPFLPMSTVSPPNTEVAALELS
jgi:LytS/YehU family sensor histidine kinase